MNSLINQQKHGYRNGHKLIGSTVRLDRTDQDAVDRLSDLSGQIRPGEVVPPYLTVYPLPSRAYRVVARTWPDLSAPRAGCVLTRSLLVPSNIWDQNPHLASLLRHLMFPSEDELRPFALERSEEPFPPISDPRASEIIEALFLEARKPIVIFDAKDADTLATRLLTAFWPAFRRDFSVCTYALGPRKIGGRDFDLVFSPKTVRSRFSDWSGRKIDAGQAKSPRHRWSSIIADGVFASPHPTLGQRDALGLLGPAGPGDESAFRKSLLWNELREKAPSSATAVLGMIDIVNSQPGLASHAMINSSQLLVSAIGSAIKSMPVPEAWAFLQTLAAKVEGKEDLQPIRLATEVDARELATSDPEAAVTFTRRFLDDADHLPFDVLCGLGNGLAEATNSLIDYRLIPDAVGAFLLANSTTFLGDVARRIRSGKTRASDLSSYLQIGDSTWRDRAAAKLLSEVDESQFAPLLPDILRRTPTDEMGNVIAKIALRTGMAVPEFDEPILAAIRDEGTLHRIRGVVAALPNECGADRFLAKTIRLVSDDIDWLSGTSVSQIRSAALLSTVLSVKDDRAVIEAQRDEGTRKKMLSILSRDIFSSATGIARVLLLGAVPIEDLLEFCVAVVEVLPQGQLRSDLIGHMLERALLEASTGDKRVESAVAHYFEDVGIRQLIWWTVPDRVSAPRLARNLQIISQLPNKQRHMALDSIDVLSDRLSRRGVGGLDEEVCASWAKLLWDSSEASPAAHLRGASASLSATIHMTHAPVGEVLAAAFPAVYHELVSRNQEDNDSLFGLLLAMPRMLMNDWDRAKPARHGLVDAFMESVWPPAYLLLAASRAGIVERICLRVSRQKGGKKYLNGAVADLVRLPQDDINMIKVGLDSFARGKMDGEWD